MEAFEHWAPPWPQLCSMLGAEGLRQALAERRKHAEQWELRLGEELYRGSNDGYPLVN